MTLIEVGVIAAKERGRAPARAGDAQERAAAGRAAPRAERARNGAVAQLVERRSFREPFVRTLTANVAANLIRNVWSYAIIFCGHFPDQTYTFTQEETDGRDAAAPGTCAS